MKTFPALFPMVFFILFLSCEKPVPQPVSKAFSEKFLGVKEVEWTKTENYWVATFYMEKFQYMTARYSPNGVFKDFELKISGEDVPKDLVDKISERFPDAFVVATFERNTEDSYAYIFELIDKGRLSGILLTKEGDMTKIPEDDQRFLVRIIIEND